MIVGGDSIIELVTVLAVIILLLRCVGMKKEDKHTFVYKINAINKCYRDLFLDKDLIIRLTQSILIMLSEVFSFISIYIIIIRYFDEYFSIKIDYLIKLIIIIAIGIFVHYIMGYMLLFTSKMHIFACKGDEESIKADFLLSYFITTTYLAFLVVFPEYLYKYVISGILGVIISYTLNFKILFRIMKNPRSIKFSKADEGSIGNIMIAALLVVGMIVISLYLGVCITNAMEPNSFSNNPSNFDLLYYTIVTFTTIGFGDISPLTMSTKIIAIIISLTSIICLTIFLGNIYSYRDKRG